MSSKSPNIFVSYRRADAKTPLLQLHKRLVRAYGKDAIFLDTSKLRGGDIFPDVLREKIREADAVLVIIGTHWSRPAKGEKTDWVVEEVAHALKYGRTIIPVLVEDATFPERLPTPIKDLGKRHSVALRPESFAADLNGLLKVLPQKPEATRITHDTVERLRVVQTVQAHRERVSQVLWSSDGKLVVSASDDGTVAWLRNGKVRTREGHEEPIRCISLHANQKELLSLSADLLRVWDTAAKLQTEGSLEFDEARLFGFAASSQGPIFVASSIGNDPEVYITPQGEKDGAFVRTVLHMHSRLVATAMTFSPDGTMFVAGATDGDIAAWIVEGRQSLWVKHARRSPVSAVAISDEGQLVAAAQEGLISVRKIVDGSELLKQATTADVTSLAFVPGGEVLVCGSEAGTPLFLHVPSRKLIASPVAIARAISCVASSADGTVLAVGTPEGQVQKWGADE